MPIALNKKKSKVNSRDLIREPLRKLPQPPPFEDKEYIRPADAGAF